MAFNLTTKQVLKYTLLPEVGPRLRELVSTGFGNLAYVMALVYRAAHLLPANHPYLKKGAIHSYSIGNVLGEASRNLVFDRKHVDQIIIFFALLSGLLILAMQFIILAATMLINPAFATQMPANYGEFFTTENPEEDIALRMLDSVFGVQGIFGSMEPTQQTFHEALHGLFQIYSIGLLVIAAMIIAYFVFAVLAETAQTGTPFGKRFNHVWAPIRLVAAIGLLIPIGTGLNSAQWITLYAAKFGSGFATNAWNRFNETFGGDTYIERDEAIATPEVPSLKNIAAFMFTVHACHAGYIELKPEVGNEINAYLVDPYGVVAPIVMPNNPEDAYRYADGRDILIRFGVMDMQKYAKESGGVYPYCGDIVITNNEPRYDQAEAQDYNSAGPEIDIGTNDGDGNLTASQILNDAYYNMIYQAWQGQLMAQARNVSQQMMLKRLTHQQQQDPDGALKTTLTNELRQHMEQALEQAVQAAREQLQPYDDYERFGWGGAGIWYNTIADNNGRIVDGLIDKPQVKKYPDVMEFVCEKNQQQNKNTAPKDCYRLNLSKGQVVKIDDAAEKSIAAALSDVHDYWYKSVDDATGNAFIDAINLLLGTETLFSMCRNADIHPLAQLSSVGKSLVNAAIRNLGIAFGSGAASVIGGYFGPTLSAASSFFSSIAGIGLMIGFLLYYILPFLPFLYFLFAVGGWVKGIFEAMVGVPLWALAHLRIDGEGLPGDGAMNGYFLIFEVFIRPILIVFGMLASIVIFAGMVKVLNDIFYVVVSNLTGFDNTQPQTGCGAGAPQAGAAETGSIDYMRGPVDEFFFTILYAIVVYMIGMSSFKLIDQIPNKILRWMGSGVPTFNDQAGEPAAGLMQKLSIGGAALTDQVSEAGKAGASSVSSAIKGLTAKN